MYKTISGILRLLLAIVASIRFYTTCSDMQFFQKFSAMSFGTKMGTTLVFILMINFIVYMVVNGIRELKKKSIRLSAMYYIICFTYLISAWVMISLINIDSYVSYFSITMLVTIFSLLLAVYYLFADFIAFFVKRKSKLRS